MEERKVLLSVKDLDVKFRVRGRILTAIRGISLDIYENESIAIVGESGSGKSVFTKTFAGMLDSNGYIDRGSVIFNDPELSDTSVKLSGRAWSAIRRTAAKLDGSAKYEHGAEIYKQILELESERKRKATLSEEEDKRISDEIHDLEYQRTEANNLKQTFDPKKEKDKIREITAEVERLEKAIKEAQENREKLIKEHKQALDQDTEYNKRYQERMAELKADYAKACAEPVTDEQKARDLALAKEFYLSTGRYGTIKRNKCINALVKNTVKAMKLGVDLSEDGERDSLYPEGVLRCRILDEDETKLHGTCIHGLPGPDDLAQPDHHDRQADHVRHPEASGLLRDRSARPRAGADEEGRHSQCGKPLRRLSVPVFRRHAPAYRHRHCPELPSQDPHLRRADDGAGRDDPGADPEASEGSAEGI